MFKLLFSLSKIGYRMCTNFPWYAVGTNSFLSYILINSKFTGTSLLWGHSGHYGVVQNRLWAPAALLLCLGPGTFILCWIGCQATNQKKRCLLGMVSILCWIKVNKFFKFKCSFFLFPPVCHISGHQHSYTVFAVRLVIGYARTFALICRNLHRRFVCWVSGQILKDQGG